MATSIPALHVSSKSKVKGGGIVFIFTRQDIANPGTFTVKLAVSFDPAINDYPVGSIHIESRLSDGSVGNFDSTTIELINSHGKHNPTVFISGQCKDSAQPDTKGCRYWLMIANNKTAPNQEKVADVVSFTIHDRNGNRVAYGTGPVREGDFEVQAFN